MELLGPTLEDLMHHCGKKFTLNTILGIADQLLSRVAEMHQHYFIHRDIKPDNVTIGLRKRINTIYLLDMGLAKYYMNPNTGKHIPYKDKKELTGSIRYASTNTHMGIEQSRRDDLESLGFVLVYLSKGKLPWQGVNAKDLNERCKLVAEKMLKTPIEKLCEGLPGI